MPLAFRRLGYLIAVLLVCIGVVYAPRAGAAPDDALPDALKPWIGWSLKGSEDERCVAINEVRTCVFPSALALSADARSASFSLRVQVDGELPSAAGTGSAAIRGRAVSLPGSAEHFPLEVREGKNLLPVLDSAGTPTVWLEPGSHTLSGRFAFAELPDTLQLPPDLALLELRVTGARVAFPKREASGLLWLKQSSDAGEEERLDLSVHRRIDDAVPLYLTTRVHVSAGGKAREVVLPHVLVAGTRPIELRAGLPVELTPEGALRLQVQAGEHDIEIVAIRESETSELSAPEAAAPWPERELWVLKANEQLRHLEVSGPSQIDPARTDLAPDWRGLPCYVMEAKQTLKLETRRRGEPEPPPNQLSLRRSLWLDLDGDGYTARDTLSGSLQRGFRLDLLSANLGHAVDHGADQLITQHAKHSGVELRQREVQLQTEWRLEHGQRELPAVGYNEDAHSLETTLNLPPGFMLLGAEGVDQLSGTWLESWDLFDFFFVLLVALGVAKVAGRGWGLAALLALVLSHQDGDAPSASWVLLLAMSALLQALKSGRIHKWLRVGWGFALVCVVITLLPYSVLQVRKALYPHLDAQASSMWEFGTAMAPPRADDAFGAAHDEAAPMASPATPAPPEVEAAGGALQEAPPQALKEVLSQRGGKNEEESPDWLQGASSYDGKARPKRAKSRAYKLEIDPSAVVQTGPGLPSWNFRQYSLSWTGPVQKDQRIQLWLLPPQLMRAWSLASVLFSGLLLLALVRAVRRKGRRPPSVPPAPGGHTKESLATTFVGLLVVAALTLPSAARAQSALPSSELLGELRQRLLEPAPCEPHCLSVASLFVRVDPVRLSLTAEVHVQARATYTAPGPLASWAPDNILVDGKDALGVVRSEDGFLRVLLAPGVHKLELSGPIPPSLAFTLALGDPPHQVRAEHKGFVIDGLRDDGRAEGSLSIRREVRQRAAEAESAQGLVQWFEVRRELELGVRFRVHTTVTRLGAATDSALVRVPLLPGEEVSEAGLASDHGSVVLNLPRGESTASYASSLAPVPELTLRAPKPSDAEGSQTLPLSEVWIVAPSVLYRPTFEGIAAILHVDAAGTYQPQYRPFPGETLRIRAARLSGAEGSSTTTDSAHVRFTPGTRLEQATLTLQIRTSRGSTERLILPRDAQLHSVLVDGSARPARLAKDGKLELHLDPGAHQVVVSLQRPRGMEFSYQPFRLGLERPLTNVTSEVQMPQGRWLLFARGPAWGPAVLFWGYLVVVLLCAGVLGQLPLTPLKTYQWLLLALGLTQVEAPVALVVVGWLFAIANRERRWPSQATVFNLTQVALVLLTLAALGCLGYAVHSGLVVQPSMQVEGMGSSDQLLRWYADRTGGAFPDVGVWSAPLWIYKALMLLWALWLAALVIRWLRWSLFSLRTGGGWQARKPRSAALGQVPAAPAGSPPAPPHDGGESGPEGAGVP
jgi:hypothetical protein